MSKSVNKAIIVGHLGSDPELRYTATGKAVANFSVATNSTWKNADGEKQESVEWHRVTVWLKLAELVAEYCKKGAHVYVEGRLQTNSYDKDGVTVYSTQIVAEDILFLDRRYFIS